MAIKALKYPPKTTGWGVIFARVLLGYLAHDRELATADLIIPMPSSPLPAGTPRKGNDHTGWVIESAIEQSLPDLTFPFRLDPPVIVKTKQTSSMVSAVGVGGRADRADEIYQSLMVVDPGAVRDRTVVVFDDVFTTGSTLNVVARRLREAGARRVRGLTMARQPWW
jgi:predicted amidophosphoribosyltransferase